MLTIFRVMGRKNRHSRAKIETHECIGSLVCCIRVGYSGYGVECTVSPIGYKTAKTSQSPTCQIYDSSGLIALEGYAIIQRQHIVET